MSTKGTHKISIILPVYNGGDQISNNINEFIKACEDLDHNYELIIVNDGSTDNTYDELSKFSSDTIKVISFAENRGKGAALTEGVRHVTGDLVTFIDSDLDLHPSQISTFIDYMTPGHDIVIGSKRHSLSEVHYPRKRQFLSVIYQLFVRVLFGMDIKDTQTGLKLFRKGILIKILPRVVVKKYAFDLEVLAVANRMGYNIIEAPVKLDYQFNGSWVTPKEIQNILYDTCAIFYRLKILKYYD